MKPYDEYQFNAIDIRSSNFIRVTKIVNGYQIKIGKEILQKLHVTDDNFQNSKHEGLGITISFYENKKYMYIVNAPNKSCKYTLSGSLKYPKVYSESLGKLIEDAIGKNLNIYKTIIFPKVDFYSRDENKQPIVIVDLTKYFAASNSFAENSIVIKDFKEIISKKGGTVNGK